MTFSNQKSPTKPAVEDDEAVVEEEEVFRSDHDEVDGDVKIPQHLRMSAERESGTLCQHECITM